MHSTELELAQLLFRSFLALTRISTLFVERTDCLTFFLKLSLKLSTKAVSVLALPSGLFVSS